MQLTDKKGFTLIEILVVVVIIGIMAAFAMPNYLKWLPNMRLKAAARDIYSTIQKARLVAAKQNVCTGVSFSTVTYPVTGGSYILFVDDGSGAGTACDGIQSGTETTVSLSSIVGKDSSLISASNIGGPSTVCYTPTSVTCSSQSGNIQVRNNESRWYKVTVTAAGGVRVEKSGDGINWSN